MSRNRAIISAILVAAGALVYGISPVDIIPELLTGPLGLIDDLAVFCRAAQEHDLIRLELWDRIRGEDDNDAFAPDAESQFDLSAPSAAGAALIRDLVAYCQLDVDLDVLDGDSVDDGAWAELVDEVASCFATED